jgi:hypothetical protein
MFAQPVAKEEELLVLLFSETLSWLLRELLQLKDHQAAYFGSSQGKDQLQKVVHLVLGLTDRCEPCSIRKAVARHCCIALGPLKKWIVKDSLPLVKCITDWLIETTEEFVGYPDVVWITARLPAAHLQHIQRFLLLSLH